MSRGHGKWERAILAALEQVAAFYLTDLLPTPHTRSQVVAVNRATRNLAAANKIATCAWMFGAQRHAVYRFGYPPPERHQIISLKSCTITPRGNSATHKRRPVTIDGEFEVTLHKPPSDL
jgi:hypothetical protein